MDREWVVQGVQRPEQPPHVGTVVHLVKTEPQWGPVLVVAGCGGGGATTTTLGVAAQISAAARPVAVDGTPTGGDLAVRGADLRLVPTSMQTWLAARSRSRIPLQESLSRATSGAAVLSRDANPLPHRETLGTVTSRLIDEGLIPIIDGGSAVSAAQIRPILEHPDVRVVVTIPARPDASNRVAITLRHLDAEFGDDLTSEVILAVSHQTPSTLSVGQALADHYSQWTRGVVEIPFDQHLSTGMAITNATLRATTRMAYHDLASWLLPELGLPEEGAVI